MRRSSGDLRRSRRRLHGRRPRMRRWRTL
ncbi:MAG: hypothetical protein HY286_12070 [Planctomycetes bacterium]|nr:hypothetical protein [Planctomycetota bacterium]